MGASPRNWMQNTVDFFFFITRLQQAQPPKGSGISCAIHNQPCALQQQGPQLRVSAAGLKGEAAVG